MTAWTVVFFLLKRLVLIAPKNHYTLVCEVFFAI